MKNFIRKSGLIPRSFAPVEIIKGFKRFGIKPDGIINFLTNEPLWSRAPQRLLRKIFILSAMAILLSCEALPFNYSVKQSWLIDSSASLDSTQEKIRTTMTVLGVQIDRSGVWDSVEREAASLAPLYFWDQGCRVVSAEEKPQYAAYIWIRERDFNQGWKSKKSLSVEVRIWAYEDAPVNGAPEENHKLPDAVGRVVMTGDTSFSSSNTMGKLLSRAITQAVKQLAAYKDNKNV